MVVVVVVGGQKAIESRLTAIAPTSPPRWGRRISYGRGHASCCCEVADEKISPYFLPWHSGGALIFSVFVLLFLGGNACAPCKSMLLVTAVTSVAYSVSDFSVPYKLLLRYFSNPSPSPFFSFSLSTVKFSYAGLEGHWPRSRCFFSFFHFFFVGFKSVPSPPHSPPWPSRALR